MKLKMLLMSAAMAGLAVGAGAPAVAAEAEIGAWGFDLAGMNRDVAPGADFFEFANGRWNTSTEIPGDRSTWGVSSVLRERAAERVRELIEGYAASRQPAGSDRAKITRSASSARIRLNVVRSASEANLAVLRYSSSAGIADGPFTAEREADPIELARDWQQRLTAVTERAEALLR